MKQAVKKTFNYFENLDPGLLPDLSSKAVGFSKELSSRAICHKMHYVEQAQAMDEACDPDAEVLL
jgi:hypothetical protein